MMPVDTKHEKYSEMMPYWELMEDVTSSQKVVQDKGDLYLPVLDEMTDTQYTAYKQRASFPMYTKHTLSTFVGMVLRKNIKTENVPEELTNNIDGAGTSIHKYLHMLVTKFLTYGRCASFVDYGSSRTKVLRYDAENIINWATKVIDGVEKLTLVVLRENITENIDEFTSVPKYRYRVLSLEPNKDETKYYYKQRMYDHEGALIANSEIYPRSKHKKLSSIPIEIHGGIEPNYPPLMPIAEQNLNYYRLDADYKHGLHYIALPTPYVVGVDKDDDNAPTTVGPTQLWYIPDGGTAGMLEFTGTGIKSIAEAKEETYENIVILSSRILAPPTAQNETATAANIRNAGETASLAEMIGQLSEELTRVLNYAVNWTETVKNVSARINTDFIPLTLSGSDVASYVASQFKGGISKYTLFHLLKKGEIIKGDRALEDELADIKKEMLERHSMERKLAEDLAKIASTYKPEASQEQHPEKAGEQVNKGQRHKEN